MTHCKSPVLMLAIAITQSIRRSTTWNFVTAGWRLKNFVTPAWNGEEPTLFFAFITAVYAFGRRWRWKMELASGGFTNSKRTWRKINTVNQFVHQLQLQPNLPITAPYYNGPSFFSLPTTAPPPTAIEWTITRHCSSDDRNSIPGFLWRRIHWRRLL